jgi:hypothetical protein
VGAGEELFPPRERFTLRFGIGGGEEEGAGSFVADDESTTASFSVLIDETITASDTTCSFEGY